MTKARFYRTEAIVLKQTPIGDADRVLILLTPDMGKLRAVARGARKSKSKLGGHVEVLNHVRLSLAQGRNLDVVTQADTIHSFRQIKETLEALSKAIYMADLVNNFTAQESPNYAIYRLLWKSLHWLEERDIPPLTLRYFEMKLLFHSGYQPQLHQCVHCRSELMPSDHLFSSALGGIICPDCRVLSSQATTPVTLNTLKVIRHLQRREYPEVAQVKVSLSLAGELERIMRNYINYLLEREVKSVSFMSLVASGTSSDVV